MAPFGIQTPNSFTPVIQLANGLPAIPQPSLGNGVIDLPLDVGYSGMPKNLHRGYMQSWNLTLQKESGWRFTGQAGYVATRSVWQLAYVDSNASQQPFTNQQTEPLSQKWGLTAGATFIQPVGTGTYDLLQASLQRRFNQSLMLNVNHTWGKAINYVDNSSYTPAIQSLAYMKWLAHTPVLTQAASGWQINNLVSLMSGPPFSGYGCCGAGWPGNSPTMTDIVAPARKLGKTGGYNADSTVGASNLRAPGVVHLDLGVFRDFAVTERECACGSGWRSSTSRTRLTCSPRPLAGRCQYHRSKDRPRHRPRPVYDHQRCAGSGAGRN